MFLDEEHFKAEAVRMAAYLMAETARTAPKSKGEDDVAVVYVDGEDLEKIALEMEVMATETGDRDFVRDAESLRKSQALLLLGVNGSKSIGVSCGACGFESCSEFKKASRREVKFVGPNCMFKLLDLGIALGSAAKLSAVLGVDTRIMYRIGVAARRLGYINSDVVMAIPIAATGKSPFFDRAPKK